MLQENLASMLYEKQEKFERVWSSWIRYIQSPIQAQ